SRWSNSHRSKWGTRCRVPSSAGRHSRLPTSAWKRVSSRLIIDEDILAGYLRRASWDTHLSYLLLCVFGVEERLIAGGHDAAQKTVEIAGGDDGRGIEGDACGQDEERVRLVAADGRVGAQLVLEAVDVRLADRSGRGVVQRGGL